MNYCRYEGDTREGSWRSYLLDFAATARVVDWARHSQSTLTCDEIARAYGHTEGGGWAGDGVGAATVGIDVVGGGPGAVGVGEGVGKAYGHTEGGGWAGDGGEVATVGIDVVGGGPGAVGVGEGVALIIDGHTEGGGWAGDGGEFAVVDAVGVDVVGGGPGAVGVGEGVARAYGHTEGGGWAGDGGEVLVGVDVVGGGPGAVGVDEGVASIIDGHTEGGGWAGDGGEGTSGVLTPAKGWVASTKGVSRTLGDGTCGTSGHRHRIITTVSDGGIIDDLSRWGRNSKGHWNRDGTKVGVGDGSIRGVGAHDGGMSSAAHL